MRLALFVLFAFAAAASAQELKPWTGGATPALELADVDGKLHRLADYRGRAVLVNFWATWCAPCREEMPSMEALREALQGRPFVVLAVNVGEGARAARDFAAALNLGFPLLLDRDTKTAKAWGARILPATYVVGHDGKIRFSHLGAMDWNRPEVREAIQGVMP